MIPNKWGQGQLFAFSALDGESLFTDDFAGILAGDRIGVTFFSAVKRILYFENFTSEMNPVWEAVTGDVIILSTLSGYASMIFAEKHLVVGEIPESVYLSAEVCGENKSFIKGDTEIHDTLNSEFTALLKRGRRFSFAYGKTADEAESKAAKPGWALLGEVELTGADGTNFHYTCTGEALAGMRNVRASAIKLVPVK